MIEIFGTLGPACADPMILEQMFRRGMSGIRLNLSHASLKESRDSLDCYYEAAERAGVKPELLIDMQGPELRIGRLEKPLVLNENETLILSCREEEDSVYVDNRVIRALEADDIILIDDGKIELRVKDTAPTWAVTTVHRGGVLSSRKSVKVVGKDIIGPVLTETDLINIRDAKEYGVTALMQPFVTSADQLKEVRKVLDENGGQDIRIFAKIESRKGIAKLSEIADISDMIVIARGDLGNDMPLWELPRAQKEIEKVCLDKNKPFLVVTQMLSSMIHSPVPTRAEVSDIFNAVADGCAAVMVTNETAAGEYPAEVIRYLRNTADEAEKWLKEQ